ncbi:D-isomer-specific 2-hydroxyacid dehydrogenase NAD-binding subunit [Meredithblackwellia eburnea MCA 4105]
MISHSIAILDDYQQVALKNADWQSLAPIPITVFSEAIPVNELEHTLKQFTIIHAMRERTKFPKELLQKLTNLKLLTTTGMRNRGIDLDAATSLGITVCGCESSGNGSTGTVEQTWALILSLSRRILIENENVRSGKWQTGIATSLHGRQLGLIGAGRLGSAVANVAKAFGMKTVAWSPNLTKERAEVAGVELAPSLDNLLSTSDVVSLHLVSSASTKGILGARELALLKPTAILVNTSRGPLIDEDALLDLIKSKRILGVGLDVFDQEPLPKDHPIRSLDGVVLSPHMGYVEDENYNSWFKSQVANIQAFLKGQPINLMN